MRRFFLVALLLNFSGAALLAAPFGFQISIYPTSEARQLPRILADARSLIPAKFVDPKTQAVHVSDRIDAADQEFLQDALALLVEILGIKTLYIEHLSLRTETQNLLRTLLGSATLKAHYEQTFGGQAARLLAEARQSGDWLALEEVYLSYPMSEAGEEARELLARGFLNRGRFEEAAIHFSAEEKNPWFNSGLGQFLRLLNRFHLEGFVEEQWNAFSRRFADGVRAGQDLVPLAQLRRLIPAAAAQRGYEPLMRSLFLPLLADDDGLVPARSSILVPNEALDAMVQRRVIPRIGIKQLVHTGWSTCFVDLDHQLECPMRVGVFGPRPEELQLIAEDGGVRTLAAGRDHVCALTLKDRAICWGGIHDSHIPINVREELATAGIELIAAGTGSTCVVTKDNRLSCWGRYPVPNEAVSAEIAEHGKIKTLALGDNYICVVGANDLPICWGGLVEVGLTDQRLRTLEEEGGITHLAAGAVHVCFATQRGKVHCVGEETGNRLKVPPEISRTAGNESIEFLAAGNSHTCLATKTRKILCWGYLPWGPVDAPQVTAQVVKRDGLQELVIGSFSFNTCVITQKKIPACWPGNVGHTLIDGNFFDRTFYRRSVERLTLTLQKPVVAEEIAAGGYFSCLLDLSGQPHCTGQFYQQALSFDLTLRKTITAAGGLTGLTAGRGHVCGLSRKDRMPVCWGLENRPVVSEEIAAAVREEGGFKQISAGFDVQISCGVSLASRIHCWPKAPNNLYPYTTAQTLNRLAEADRGYESVSLGFYHVCGLTRTGKVFCTYTNTPVAFPAGEIQSQGGAQKVRTNPSEICVLTKQQHLLCRHPHSQIRVEAWIGSNPETTIVLAFDNEYSRTCLINADYEVRCSRGSVEPLPETIKAALREDEGIRTFAVGANHYCVLSNKNRPFCWGLAEDPYSATVLQSARTRSQFEFRDALFRRVLGLDGLRIQSY